MSRIYRIRLWCQTNQRGHSLVKTTPDKRNSKAQRVLSATLALADIQSGDYDAVFDPGGHGPLWDLAEDAHSIALIESTLAAGKPLALACHAPGALRRAKAGDGSPLIAGRHVTGFSDSEEEAVDLTDVVPFLVEDELKQLGGFYTKGPDWTSFVKTDGNLITGQNPAFSAQAARVVIQILIGRTKNNPTAASPHFYLIGSGIASIAAAAFLIRVTSKGSSEADHKVDSPRLTRIVDTQSLRLRLTSMNFRPNAVIRAAFKALEDVAPVDTSNVRDYPICIQVAGLHDCAL